jgi:hypothetical protein
MLWAPCLALLLASIAGAAEKAADPEAEKLMHDSHAARSTWGPDFPGFTARLKANLDGKEVEGDVTIRPDGKIDLKLPDNPVSEWARRQLQSIVMHRQAGVRDRYNVAFADDQTDHPLGRLIQFLDSKNQYRVKGDLVTEVHRDMGRTRFTITVTDVTRDADGKQLPRAFSVSYWNGETGELTRAEDYQEEWTRLGKFGLPKRRLLIQTMKGERSVGELKLSEHQLLPAKAAK